MQLSEVAVSIPISGDTIHALTGSGIKLNREEFAYMGTGGEGVSALTFVFAHWKPKASFAYFSRMALASSDSWLDDFLRKYGTAAAAKVAPAVHRDEEATAPGVPAPQAPGLPKRTSSPGPRLTDLIDEFLG